MIVCLTMMGTIFDHRVWIVLLLHSMVTAGAETRCYCNDVSCVRTSYMCKSTSGTCYTKLSLDGAANVRRGNHGCLELLPEADSNACAVGGVVSRSIDDVGTSGFSMLLCCHEDMCNYVDSVVDEIGMTKTNNRVANKTDGLNSVDILSAGHDDITGRAAADKNAVQQFTNHSPVGDTSNFFQMAVIVVPVIGAVILVLLIVTAVRMLRSDRRHRRRHCVSLINHVISEHNTTCQILSESQDICQCPIHHFRSGYYNGQPNNMATVDMSVCCHGSVRTCSCSGPYQSRCLLNHNSEKIYPFSKSRTYCVGKIWGKSDDIVPVWDKLGHTIGSVWDRSGHTDQACPKLEQNRSVSDKSCSKSEIV